MPTEDPKPVDPRHDEHLEHSAYSLLTVIGILAAEPFANAMLAELGTGSAKATREALSRVLRRQAPSLAPASVIPLKTNYGWQIQIDTGDLPSREGWEQAARLNQSAPLDSEGQPIASGQIAWRRDRWIASPAAGVAIFYWDDARNQWVLPPYAGGPPESATHA